MSSARSNAGARNRRAGGAETAPMAQQNMRPGSSQQQQQQSQQQQQPQMNPRLSISDAIALITLRLGRVENLIQNMPVDSPNGAGLDFQQDENMRMIDVTVFENIVSRLDNLEKGQKTVSDKQTQQQQQQLQQHTQYQQQLNSIKLSTATQSSSSSSLIIDTKSEENISKLNDSVDVLKAEIVQVKDLLLKLQSFTMETNQKLSDIVFNDAGNLDECMDDNIECAMIEQSEIQCAEIQSADIQVQIPKGLSLKEKVELAISEQKTASTENADVLSA
jgi:hypothetical protein